ncbi:MAG TPA: hypothetical protein DD473_15965 [Planctomycetaceae bacterium]|nr:hypothetical protein [Planctomycetaceae bacterium]
MELLIQFNGNVRCIYGEKIDLRQIGCISIQRGSHVEPTVDGCWQVDLSPVDGPSIGPFKARSHALQAEESWLLKHWLIPKNS